MSVTDILNELPQLTEADRLAVRGKLTELAAENEDRALCEQAALDMFQKLDGQEKNFP